MVGLVLGIGVEETGRSEDRERHGCEEASEFFLMCFFLLSLWLLLWAVAGVAVARLCVFWFLDSRKCPFLVVFGFGFPMCRFPSSSLSSLHTSLSTSSVLSHHQIDTTCWVRPSWSSCSLSLSPFIFFLLSCTNRMSMRVWFHFRLSLTTPLTPHLSCRYYCVPFDDKDRGVLLVL
ncbi:hypothetical protein VTJ04DRAFT_6307 [Mycothermus thermophilus]|uniref:uncharacterized protein n=1 Tax=Humicola insolens TaxID=85995 RepID=UPI0037447019